MKVIHLVESSIWMVTSDPQRYRRSPDAIVQSTIIFDMEGFTMSHFAQMPMSMAKKLMPCWEDANPLRPKSMN